MRAIYDYYQNLSSEYDQDRFGNSYGQYIHRQEQQWMKKYLTNGKTLSLGCGTGRFMEFGDVGLDISPNMLAEAQKKHPRKEFIVGNANATQLPTSSFDTVFSMHVLMHLNREDTRATFAEVHRILKPKGHFIFDIPSAHRRQLTGYKAANWHAGNAWTIEGLKDCLSTNWEVKVVRGILAFPIHQVPSKLRQFFLPIDTLICSSPLKKYASYLFFKIQKK